MTQQLITAAKALQDYATANGRSSIPWDMGPLFDALRAAVEAAEKQPVQEPVGSLTVWRHRGNDSMVNTDFDYLGGLPDGTYSVYAAPVAQLSGEQLRDIARTYKSNDQQRMRDHWDLFVDFARAIEAAHGIVGKP